MSRRPAFDPDIRHPPLPGAHALVRFGVPVVVLGLALASVVYLTNSPGAGSPSVARDAASSRGAFAPSAATALPDRTPAFAAVDELPQPLLHHAATGESWRLFVVPGRRALPTAAEAMLAVHWGAAPPHVDVLDAQGRVAVRIETGYAPMARLNAADNTLVVSDWHGEGEGARARVLVVDLGMPAAAVEFELPARRVNFHFFANAMAVSDDGRWLYWVEHNAGACPGPSVTCDAMAVRALDLDAGQDAGFIAAVPRSCTVGGLAPAGGSAVVAACAHGGERYLVDVAIGSVPVEVTYAVPAAEWDARAIAGADVHLRLVTAPDGAVTAMKVVDNRTGGVLLERPLDETWQVAMDGPSSALLLRSDGRLERMDLWTGDVTQLAYAIDPGAQGQDVALVR
ncbi:MAG: hypothetical protein IT303_15780 [Dehalococcoidia bacterium]|nr:hypothetical protein [Dehalococcoidia bacterium]